MSCAMIYWGKHYQRFYDVFIHYGAVVDITHLKGEIVGPERASLQGSFIPVFEELDSENGKE